LTSSQNTEENPKETQNQTPFVKQNKFWIIILIIVTLFIWSYYFTGLNYTEISYTKFKSELQKDNVEEVTLKGLEVTGSLKSPSNIRITKDNQIQFRDFITHVPSFGDEKLLTLLNEKDVTVNTEPKPDNSFAYTLIAFLPLLLIAGLIFFQYKRSQGQGGGIFSIGKNQAKLYSRSEEATKFDDVAGAESAKTELQEIVSFLKNPEDIFQIGGEVPKGLMLVGPPGTGKTLLARAVAGEADVPFFSITGSDFMEMFVGVGAKRVRNLFADAKNEAPCIIFIDELDAIGRRRGAGLGGGHDEREQTLNQLLSELDGFESKENVIVMTATNRPDVLDPALSRPGRFDRQVTVDLPSKKDREHILQIYAQNKNLDEDVKLEEIARGTPGFSGADLRNLLNEATLLVARNNKQAISYQEIEQARDKILMGLERHGLALTEDEKRLIAYHEAGHAIVGNILPHADPIHKVSIIPRTMAMGATQQFPEQERYIYKREYMQERLAIMLGGRSAETLIFNTATSGAGNDLQEATKLARKMVLEWGMSEEFEHMAPAGGQGEVFLGEELAQKKEYSEKTNQLVDEAVESILKQAYSRAYNILNEHRDALKALAEILVEEEEISGEKVDEIVGQKS